MTAGTAVFESGQDALNEVGLVEGHSYTLLSACEITYKNQNIRLVKLRNPWGNEVSYFYNKYIKYKYYCNLELTK